MATTTPNYGWTVPTSTDLVKDGATAIETLGDAIDASMNTALGTKKAGMVLLNTTSFSAVAAQNFSNVLSSTYTNYRVLISNLTNSVDTGVRLRFRENVTDKATNYLTSSLRIVSNNTVAGAYAAAATEINMFAVGSTATFRVLEISRPSATTGLVYLQGLDIPNGEQGQMFSVNSSMSNFTGFSIFPASGNVSGTVSIYGYNI